MITTQFVRQFFKALPRRQGTGPHQSRSAVTGPAASGSRSVRAGDMFAAVHVDFRGEDRVHGGSANLTLWPASLPEQQLAGEWLDIGLPATRDELYAICGSIERACAIALDVRAGRREAEADRLLRRAFGRDLEWSAQ